MNVASPELRKESTIRRPQTTTKTMRSSVPSRPYPMNSSRSVVQARNDNNNSPKQKSMLENPECISIRESNWENPQFSELDNQTLRDLIVHLSEFSVFSAKNEDYKSAKRADQLLSYAKDALSFQTEIYTQRTVDTSRSTDTISKIEAKYKQKMSEFENDANEKLQMLERKHKKETEKFEKIWSTEKPNEFRKPSAKLLTLKQLEKKFANANQYDRAEETNKEFLIQQEFEFNEAQKTLISKYKHAKSLHVKKQEDEMQNFNEWKERSVNWLQLQYNEEKNKAENRNRVLQKKLQEKSCYTISPQKVVEVIIPKSRDKGSLHTTLLPPLIAPNDPVFAQSVNSKKKTANIYISNHNRDNISETSIDNNTSRSNNQLPSVKGNDQSSISKYTSITNNQDIVKNNPSTNETKENRKNFSDSKAGIYSKKIDCKSNFVSIKESTQNTKIGEGSVSMKPQDSQKSSKPCSKNVVPPSNQTNENIVISNKDESLGGLSKQSTKNKSIDSSHEKSEKTNSLCLNQDEISEIQTDTNIINSEKREDFDQDFVDDLGLPSLNQNDDHRPRPQFVEPSIIPVEESQPAPQKLDIEDEPSVLATEESKPT